MATKPNIQSFFNNLNSDTMHLVDEFYDRDIEFHDPVVNIKGVDQMRKYYQNLYQHVKSIRFEFSDEVVDGDTHAAVWKMILISGLNKGEPVELQGISHIKFGGLENKAIYHRDYFDMGQFVYEDIPVLGGVIRFIKRKLSHDA